MTRRRRVGEERIPVAGRPVAGDDQGPALPLADKFVEVISLGRTEPAHGVVVEEVGAVVKGSRASLPWFVVDAAGREIEPVSRYLRDLALCDASALTCRSYGYDLLSWFRVLWAVDVGWRQATEAETTSMVGRLRTAPNPQRRRSRPDSMPTGVVIRRRAGPRCWMGTRRGRSRTP